jgi:serine O-acetyltransferase
MRTALWADIGRYNRSMQPLTRGRALRLLSCNFGLHALLAYRLRKWLKNAGSLPAAWLSRLLLWPLSNLLHLYVRLAYDIDLHLSAEIGEGLYIGHFGGIRLRHCRLGSQCAIQQQVVLEPEPGEASGPVIGDRVWIGAHTRIFGPIRVGDGATIGAGAVVLQDIPPHCLVLGNPARAIHRDYDNSDFL